ncbi:MAG: hypothetical protein ACI3XR_10245 [Eubacteriales bacterium]
MTVAELAASVARLGFQTELEEEWQDSLAGAMHLAVREIRRVLPIYRSAELFHSPAPVASDVTDFDVTKDGYTLEIPNAGGILIELSGYANLVISSDSGVKLLSQKIGAAAPASKLHKYLVSDLILPGGNRNMCVTLTRSGPCHVLRLCAWEDGEIGCEDDMLCPVDGMVCYDLDRLYDDFGTAERIERKGYHTSNYRFGGRNLLWIPVSEVGEYRITYRQKIPEFGNNRDDEIPIGDDETDLLSLLTASYILLDEGDGKAAYYRNLYQQELQTLIRQRSPQKTGRLKDYYGW